MAYTEEELKKELDKSKAQHLNGFLSKNMNLNIKLLDQQEQKKNKYVFELDIRESIERKTYFIREYEKKRMDYLIQTSKKIKSEIPFLKCIVKIY